MSEQTTTPAKTTKEMRAHLSALDADFHPELPPNDWEKATDAEVIEHYNLVAAESTEVKAKP